MVSAFANHLEGGLRKALRSACCKRSTPPLTACLDPISAAHGVIRSNQMGTVSVVVRVILSGVLAG